MYLNHKLSVSALNVISPLFSPFKSYIEKGDNDRNLVAIVCLCMCAHLCLNVSACEHVYVCAYAYV